MRVNDLLFKQLKKSPLRDVKKPLPGRCVAWGDKQVGSVVSIDKANDMLTIHPKSQKISIDDAIYLPTLEELYEMILETDPSCSVMSIHREMDDWMGLLFPLWKILPIRDPYQPMWEFTIWRLFKKLWTPEHEEWADYKSKIAEESITKMQFQLLWSDRTF